MYLRSVAALQADALFASALRMRSARAAVRDLNDQSIPRTRRIAAPGRRDGGGTGRDWKTLLLTVGWRGTGDR
jgi:hypothetical protein